jgi:hypothetical protein
MAARFCLTCSPFAGCGKKVDWHPMAVSAETQLNTFLVKYDVAIAALASALLAKMRERLPGAVELVYDNYNALVIGFGPSERPSEAVFSIALYPRWINLYFLAGAVLPDPERLLLGSGKTVRHIVIESTADLDKSAIRALMADALKLAVKPFDASAPRRMVIRAASNKQRARRGKGA